MTIKNSEKSVVDNIQEFLHEHGLMAHDSVIPAGQDNIHDESVLNYYQYVRRQFDVKAKKPDINFELFRIPSVTLAVLEFEQHYADISLKVTPVDENAYNITLKFDESELIFIAGFNGNALVMDKNAPSEFTEYTKKDNYDEFLVSENINCGIILSIRLKSWCLYTDDGRNFMSSLGVKEPELEVPVYDHSI